MWKTFSGMVIRIDTLLQLTDGVIQLFGGFIANPLRLGSELVSRFAVDIGTLDLILIGLAIYVAARGEAIAYAAGLNEAIFIGHTFFNQT